MVVGCDPAAKYSMLQFYAKLWAPWFDHPWFGWCLDTYVDWMLRAYYWPIQVGLDIQEIIDLIQSTSIRSSSPPGTERLN